LQYVAKIEQMKNDPACWLVPPAMIGVVVLTGAFIIDAPRALRPFQRVAPFALVDRSEIPAELSHLLDNPPSPGPLASLEVKSGRRR